MNYFLEPLKKYAVFKGRSTRKEFWMFVLFNSIILLAMRYIDRQAGLTTATGGDWLIGIYRLAILVPSIAIGVRRMHDVNKSGWFILVPIYNLILACTGTKK